MSVNAPDHLACKRAACNGDVGLWRSSLRVLARVSTNFRSGVIWWRLARRSVPSFQYDKGGRFQGPYRPYSVPNKGHENLMVSFTMLDLHLAWMNLRKDSSVLTKIGSITMNVIDPIPNQGNQNIASNAWNARSLTRTIENESSLPHGSCWFLLLIDHPYRMCTFHWQSYKVKESESEPDKAKRGIQHK